MKEKDSLDINISYRNLKARGITNAGITLIALVITIVILIILATISVNIALNEDGIIGRAISAGRIQKIAEEKEQMEFTKIAVAIDNKGKIPVNGYIENLIQENIITEQNVKYNADGSIQIMTRMDRILMIEADEAGNIIAISESGQKDELTASIEKVQLTEKTSSIKVEVEVARAEDATYRYFYKTETGEYKKVYEGKDLTYAIEKLKSGAQYWIKVEATNDYGTVSKEVLGKTKAIIKGQEGAGDLSKVGEYNDKFALIVLDTSIGNLGTVTEELFIEAVKQEGSITEENIMVNSNGNYEMITKEGYVFEVILKSANNVEATYIGMIEK